jgi:hypothetical protein
MSLIVFSLTVADCDRGDAGPCVSSNTTNKGQLESRGRKCMTEKFKGKYRRASNRLASWDYSSAGAYFITICTQNRLDWFGKIEKGKMILSTMGKIA